MVTVAYTIPACVNGGPWHEVRVVDDDSSLTVTFWVDNRRRIRQWMTPFWGLPEIEEWARAMAERCGLHWMDGPELAKDTSIEGEIT